MTDLAKRLYDLAPLKIRASPSDRNTEITRRYNTGEPLADIAKDFDLSQARIQHIAWSLGGKPRQRTIRGIKIRCALEEAGISTHCPRPFLSEIQSAKSKERWARKNAAVDLQGKSQSK